MTFRSAQETFPAKSGLEICFFVNSGVRLNANLAWRFYVLGSEANDLAVRLAFARSRSRNLLVVQHGYHGHTQQSIEISPYKFDHKGGDGVEGLLGAS